MPEGLVRTDLNTTGKSYRNGFPVTEPLVFGTPVTLPKNFGNAITLPKNFGNIVNWSPSPAHFGNIIGGSGGEDDLLQEDGISPFELEDGDGNILLEN